MADIPLSPPEDEDLLDLSAYYHAYFKDILTVQLQSLLLSAASTMSLMRQADSSFAADPLDQATAEIDRNYTLRIRDRESQLIRKIRIALSKIEDGTFGVCEECEEPISIERLKARPVTAYCIQCKSKMEANERLQGK